MQLVQVQVCPRLPATPACDSTAKWQPCLPCAKQCAGFWAHSSEQNSVSCPTRTAHSLMGDARSRTTSGVVTKWNATGYPRDDPDCAVMQRLWRTENPVEIKCAISKQMNLTDLNVPSRVSYLQTYLQILRRQGKARSSQAVSKNRSRRLPWGNKDFDQTAGDLGESPR